MYIVTRRIDGIVHGQAGVYICRECYNERENTLSKLFGNYSTLSNKRNFCEFCNRYTDGLISFTDRMRKKYDTDVPERYKWTT